MTSTSTVPTGSGGFRGSRMPTTTTRNSYHSGGDPSLAASNNTYAGASNNASPQRNQFCCLYTKQKTKKKKVWQDGRLVLKSFKAQLHDANPAPGSGDPVLDECEVTQVQSLSLKQGQEARLETQMYLIHVEGPWITPLQTTSNLPMRSDGSGGMTKKILPKFRKPKSYVPPNPNTRPNRLQTGPLGKRRRPLQPGELEKQHYGGMVGGGGEQCGSNHIQQTNQINPYNNNNNMMMPPQSQQQQYQQDQQRPLASQSNMTCNDSNGPPNYPHAWDSNQPPSQAPALQPQVPQYNNRNSNNRIRKDSQQQQPSQMMGNSNYGRMTPLFQQPPRPDIYQNLQQQPNDGGSGVPQQQLPNFQTNNQEVVTPGAFQLGGTSCNFGDRTHSTNNANTHKGQTRTAAIPSKPKEQSFVSNGFNALAFYGLDEEGEEEEEEEEGLHHGSFNHSKFSWFQTAADTRKEGRKERPSTFMTSVTRNTNTFEGSIHHQKKTTTDQNKNNVTGIDDDTDRDDSSTSHNKPVSGNQLLALFGAAPPPASENDNNDKQNVTMDQEAKADGNDDGSAPKEVGRSSSAGQPSNNHNTNNNRFYLPPSCSQSSSSSSSDDEDSGC